MRTFIGGYARQSCFEPKFFSLEKLYCVWFLTVVVVDGFYLEEGVELVERVTGGKAVRSVGWYGRGYLILGQFTILALICEFSSDLIPVRLGQSCM